MLRRDAQELIDSAIEDLSVAKTVFVAGYFRATCFHSHQAVEKLLKAYLLIKTNRYPFIHDLTELIRRCSSIDEDFKYLFDREVDKLDKYYVGTRYPSLIRVSREEAKWTIKTAEEVKILIYTY